jgi:phage terminase large subunit-like protein
MRNKWLFLAVAIMTASLRPEILYAEKVLNGEIVACKLVKLACQRHLDDLKRQNTEKFPYTFDAARAESCDRFYRTAPHVEGPSASTIGGRDNRIKLELWQNSLLAICFGWRRADGTRRFRHVYFEVARKNAKTTLGAGIANYYLLGGPPRRSWMPDNILLRPNRNRQLWHGEWPGCRLSDIRY